MKKITLSLLMLGALSFAQAQQFEAPQIDTIPFSKVKPFVGGAFAIQYQGLSHSADSLDLIELGKGFNLPTANFTLGADLAPGVSVVLETYLSARHHNETWVKGGYITIDKTPFIKSDLLDGIMENVTIKVGVMELNYGDAHFRRTDNGNASQNPFVGNYIMNAFTTAPSAEVYYRHETGLFAMGGLGQVIVNQVIAGYDKNDSTYKAYNTTDELSYWAKVGYDKQLNEDFRIRGTVSYFTGQNHSLQLYSGDRAGSRYYLVMNPANTKTGSGLDIKSPHLTGDYSPNSFGTIPEGQSYMLNIFAKYKFLEFFATYENATGTYLKAYDKVNKIYPEADYDFTNYSVEALAYFGGQDQFYAGARYNAVSDQIDQSVNRIQGILGWKLTKNIVAKMEYVDQNYVDFSSYKKGEAGFDGFMFEAAITF